MGKKLYLRPIQSLRKIWKEEVKVCIDELIYVIICDYKET